MNTGLKIYKLDIDEDNLNSGVDAISLVQSPAMEEDFYLFSKSQPHMFESYADYPDGVSNNAKRGIELNEKEGNKCATQVGKVRAQQLANKEAISVETIKRMYSYLSRAEEYYDESDSSACGTISYLLWGGLAGKRWAESKLKELGLFEGAIEADLPDYANEPSGSLIVKDVFVDPRAGESKDDFIGRCIPVLIGEGKDQEQAAAICYSMWDERFNQIDQISVYFKELFDLLGHLDGIPVYSTPQEAMEVAQVAGCMGYHSHMLGDMIVYMPCEEHDAAMDALLGELYEEYKKKKGKYISDLPQGTQDKIVDALMKVGEKYNEDEWAPLPEKFAIQSFPKETSIDDTLGIKIRYRYKGPKDSKNRDFCRRMLDANLLFRKEDINNLTLAGENLEFGIYDIFTYKGSYGCRHNWERVYKMKDDEGKTINIKEVAADAATSVNAKPTAGRDPNSESLIINQFAEQQREQQIVAGPLMIPEKLIYRWDDTNGEYFVYFTRETIKRLAYKYMEQKYVDRANIEHDSEQMLKGVYLVESWIIDNPSTDKSKALTGNEYPAGTWFGLVKVKNRQVWEEYVKTGLVKGFSVEGWFTDKLVTEKM